MKKYSIGIGLILLAILVLFQDSFNRILPMPLWLMVVVIGLAVTTISAFLRGRLSYPMVTGTILFIILNHQYQFIQVNTWTIIFAAFLLLLGLKMIINPSQGRILDEVTIKGKPLRKAMEDSHQRSGGPDTVFGSSTRYINDDNLVDVGGDVVFSKSSLYFDNAVILGDKARYSGDVVFSTVKLYVPRDWAVDFGGDRVFSTVQIPQNPHQTEKTLVLTGDVVFSSLLVYYI